MFKKQIVESLFTINLASKVFVPDWSQKKAFVVYTSFKFLWTVREYIGLELSIVAQVKNKCDPLRSIGKKFLYLFVGLLGEIDTQIQI